MKVFLDACMVIYWIEMANPYYTKFINALTNINKQYTKTEIAISRLSILECLINPTQKKDVDLLRLYENFFNHPGLIITEINQNIITTAINIRATTKLKTPDAIQAASALSLGEKHIFLSNDKIFQHVVGLHFNNIAAYLE